jgi:hypothetical protein
LDDGFAGPAVIRHVDKWPADGVMWVKGMLLLPGSAGLNLVANVLVKEELKKNPQLNERLLSEMLLGHSIIFSSNVTVANLFLCVNEMNQAPRHPISFALFLQLDVADVRTHPPLFLPPPTRIA